MGRWPPAGRTEALHPAMAHLCHPIHLSTKYSARGGSLIYDHVTPLCSAPLRSLSAPLFSSPLLSSPLLPLFPSLPSEHAALEVWTVGPRLSATSLLLSSLGGNGRRRERSGEEGRRGVHRGGSQPAGHAGKVGMLRAAAFGNTRGKSP